MPAILVQFSVIYSSKPQNGSYIEALVKLFGLEIFRLHLYMDLIEYIENIVLYGS